MGADILSPYSGLFRYFLRPVKWMLTDFLWRYRKAARFSRAHLRKIKNEYENGTAVILCNGPSLLRSDLDLLRGHYTIGLNKINLLFEKTSYRPNCIVAVNKFVIDQNSDFLNITDIPVYLDSYASGKVALRENVCFINSTTMPGFARDISGLVPQGSTVTYVAMQLAFHMGFKKVALIGCDHNFAVSGPANKTVIAGDKDDSHFDPNYFSGGVQWQLPDLAGSEIAYVMAREAFYAAGRQLVNCTEGGRLELLQRMPLREFLND